MGLRNVFRNDRALHQLVVSVLTLLAYDFDFRNAHDPTAGGSERGEVGKGTPSRNRRSDAEASSLGRQRCRSGSCNRETTTVRITAAATGYTFSSGAVKKFKSRFPSPPRGGEGSCV